MTIILNLCQLCEKIVLAAGFSLEISLKCFDPILHVWNHSLHSRTQHIFRSIITISEQVGTQ